MKNLFLVLFSLTLILTSCDKPKDDLVDTDANDVEDINSLETFENRVNTGVSVVFFHASWCSICAEQRPAFENTAAKSEFDNVFFGEVEFEQNNNINQTYVVGSFPTILFLKDGAEEARLAGKGHSEAEIASQINALL